MSPAHQAHHVIVGDMEDLDKTKLIVEVTDSISTIVLGEHWIAQCLTPDRVKVRVLNRPS